MSWNLVHCCGVSWPSCWDGLAEEVGEAVVAVGAWESAETLECRVKGYVCVGYGGLGWVVLVIVLGGWTDFLDAVLLDFGL